jgi:hypothetical protein
LQQPDVDRSHLVGGIVRAHLAGAFCDIRNSGVLVGGAQDLGWWPPSRKSQRPLSGSVVSYMLPGASAY